MGLIDLKTDLKSLKFGKDRIFGGNSGQPYIKSPIPEGANRLGVLDNDFLLRGGITAVTNSGEDVLRLGRWFTDLKSPSGLLFTAKQELLSRTAVRTQTSGILNEGVYNPLSTLAQAGVNAFGIHANKQGINPFAQTGAYSNNINLYGVRVKSTQPVDKNRLAELYKLVNEGFSTSNWNFSGTDLNVGVNVLSYGGGPNSVLGIGKTNIRYADQRTGKENALYKKHQSVFEGKSNLKPETSGSNIIPLGISKNLSEDQRKLSPFTLNNKLFSDVVPEEQQKTWVSTAHQDTEKYTFSPTSSGASRKYVEAFSSSYDDVYAPLLNNSVYKSGSTFPDGTNPLNFDNGTVTYNQSMLASQEEVTTIQDFRKVIREKLGNDEVIKAGKISGQLTDAPDYVTQNVDVRTKQGQPGNKTGKNLSSYTAGSGIGPLDKINASPLGTPPNNPDNGSENDLVRFNIIPLSGGRAMNFRAFLGSISDNYSSEINAQKFVGRGENFYTYGGFDRKISLSWTVAAQSKEELIPMYKKLSYLASNLAPIYKSGFMQGPLVKLTVGGYIHELPGYITGLNFEMGEDSTWEIAINDAGDKDYSVAQLTHIIKVSGFNFTPIPNYLPQRGARFIDLWNGAKYLNS